MRIFNNVISLAFAKIAFNTCSTRYKVSCCVCVCNVEVLYFVPLQDHSQIDGEEPHPIHASPIPNHPSQTTSNIAPSHHIHSTPLPSSRSPAGDNSTSISYQQNEEPNGEIEIEKSARPVQPDDGALFALEQQLTVANDTKRQLQNELNTLRENQSEVLEETRDEVARVYQKQVASLQQSLVESEQSLQRLERELVEMRDGHRNEVESIVKQQKESRDVALHERDQKHATHILRLTAELSAQQDFVDGTKHDLDEQEAKRIQMIKESMKDMQEREIAQLKQTHEAEKSRLAEDFHRQVENTTQQMEQVANAKIQEMHAQFMSAHQSLLEQKNAVESNAEQLRAELQQAVSQIEALTVEKHKLEEQYRGVVETHSAAVKEMSSNSRNLEERVNTWKEKAANLESRLQLSGETQETVHHVQEQYESRFQALTTQYKEQMATLESVVTQRTEENALLQEQLERVKEETEKHGEEIEQLKSQHGSEVELLEKSISEAVSDKASLEVAEEHMSSLEKQLKAYRRQEGDMSAEMAKLKEEQALVVELLKQRYEQEKERELEAMHVQFTSQIEALQNELSTTRDIQTVESDRVRHREREAQTLQKIHLKHEEKLAQVKKDLQERHTQALAALQSELEEAHQSNVVILKQQHDSELEVLTTRLKDNTEHSANVEASYKAKLAELNESHDVVISNLQMEHSQTIKKLQQSLSQKGSVALSEISAQVASLEAELSRLREHEAEWLELRRDVMSQLEISQREAEEQKSLLDQASSAEAQLREQCQELRDRVQSVESDCHIAQSAKETMQQSLEHAQAQVEELRARVEALQNEAGSMEAVEAASREQAKKLLMVTEQLAERNVTIADLQSQNDTLNTEVFNLTQKCQQHVSSIEMLQRQVENAGAVSEEITTLQQQLSELAPVKEHHAQLQISLAQVEAVCQSKEEEIKALQSKLEQREEKVATLETAVQSKEGEIGLHQKECETMKEQLDQLKNTLQLRDREIMDRHKVLDQAHEKMREMEAQWQSKLEEVTIKSEREIKVQSESHSARENELQQQLQQQMMSTAQMESTQHAQQEELSSAKEELNRLQTQLQEGLSTTRQLQEANKALSAELQMSQEQSLTAQNECLADLRSKCEQLELCVSTVSSEKERLAAELVQVREESDRRVDECVSSWEGKVQKLQETIEDLHNQLNAAKQLESQRVVEGEIQEQLLHSTSLGVQGNVGTVRGQRSVVEESLSRARRKLSEKLQEKELLEKDLSFHRTELERRLGEKKRLEGLLFEKARFEQELLNQKEQLQSDLLQIDSKLQLRTGPVENEHSNHFVTAHKQQQLSRGQTHQDDISSLQTEQRR